MKHRRTTALLFGLALLAHVPGAAQTLPTTALSAPPASLDGAASERLRAVPWPELSDLEPAVREALQQGARQLSRGPSDSQAHGELGRLLHAHGFPAAAEVCYDNAGQLAQDDFRWPHLRGLVLLDEQRLAEAAAAFAEAFSRRPYYPALLRQARVEQELGHLERSAALLAIAADHSPGDPALLAVRGEQAALDGDDRAAVELLARALAAAPAATRLHYPLALSYRALGDTAAADRHLALAGRIGIVPLDPLASDVRERRVGVTAWDLEGQRALQAGDAPAAVQAFRRALAVRPDDAELRARLETALAAELALGRAGSP